MVSDEQTQPEIVWIGVIGVFASGKTTFVRTISEVTGPEKLSLNGEAPASFDGGQIMIDRQLALQFYIFPTVRRWNYIMDSLLDPKKIAPLGVIVVVDSTYPETFREARGLIATWRSYLGAAVPGVIACNKQDDPNAWSPEDLRIALRAHADEIFLPCIATDKESVKQVVLALLQQVLDRLDAAGT